MLPGGTGIIIYMIYTTRCSGLDFAHYTDHAQSLTTADEELDDLCDLSVDDILYM